MVFFSIFLPITLTEGILEKVEEVDPWNPIFQDNDMAITLLLEIGVIKPVMPCVSKFCVRNIKMITTPSFIDGKGYKCPSKKCKRKSLYCWVFSYTNYQAINFCQIAENTYIEFKNVLMDIISETPSRIEKIAVANFGSVHEIVNHSKGFVNGEDGHTNQIENFWSYLKLIIEKEVG
ncbi:DDE-TNP-IS1595 domain-containing protein [Vairimorpha necatrix]|uniref:DDE-TNP-IS1595 domain-containing protein n=1 Tax=Vairimorpha necatrix TaxID=6039 RepID=A0AAX4JEM5_9MICR